MKKIVATILAFAISVFGISQAKGATVYSLFSWDLPSKGPTLGTPGYEAKSLGVLIDDSQIDTIKFYVSMYGVLSSGLFANSGSRSPLVRVKIFRTVVSSQFGGTLGDVWIESPGTNYQASTPIAAKATAYRLEGDPNSGRVSLDRCKPLTWYENSIVPNGVGFSISRLCANLGNVFSIVGYVDPDVNNPESYPDYQWVPERLLNINLSGVPAPAKKAQTVTISQQSDISIAAGRLIVNAVSSGNLPVVYSTSGANCRFENSTSSTLTLSSIGPCTVYAYSEGDNEFTKSPTATMTFNIQQVKSAQQVSVDPIGSNFVGNQVTVTARSTSGITPLLSVTQTSNVCRFSDTSKPTILSLLSAGTCTVEVYAPESPAFMASSKITTSFSVQNITQQRFSISQVGTVSLELGSLTITTSSDSGLRRLSSLTTSVCNVPEQSAAIVTLRSEGTCTIEGFAPASGTYGNSATSRMSFTVTAPRVMQRLTIGQLGTVTLNQNLIRLNISSESGNWLISSATPDVCDMLSPQAYSVELYDSGTCTLVGYAPEDSRYKESPQTQMSFQIVIIRAKRNVAVTVPSSAKVGELVNIDISLDSEDLPDINVSTPKICAAPDPDSPYQLKMLAIGSCKFTLSLGGDRLYFPYSYAKSISVVAKTSSSSKTGSTSSGPSIGGSATTSKVKTPTVSPTACTNLVKCKKP